MQKIYLSELAEQAFKKSSLPLEDKEIFIDAFVSGFIEGTIVDRDEWMENVKHAPPSIQARYGIITPYAIP